MRQSFSQANFPQRCCFWFVVFQGDASGPPHNQPTAILTTQETFPRSMLIDSAYQKPTTGEGVVLDDGSYRKSKGLTPNNGTVQVLTGHGETGVRRVGAIPLS